MGKSVLIIGGNSGIGREVLRRLQAEDWHVLCASRNALNEEISGVEWQVYDATDESNSLELPERLDALLYCPGTINLRPFTRLKLEDFKQEMEVNFYGAIRVLQQAIPALRRGENPSVVLFSTVAVQNGMPFHAGVASAKGAIEGLVRSLAAEYAPTIRFNAIAPSLTDTPLAASLLSDDKKREASAQRHPLKKVGTPLDLASAAYYLLSDESAWVSGQVLHVDGGMSSIKTL